jgi:hypothetical protein
MEYLNIWQVDKPTEKLISKSIKLPKKNTVGANLNILI